MDKCSFEHQRDAHLPLYGHCARITWSITHGQCNDRPKVTFPEGKLYCLAPEALVCE